MNECSAIKNKFKYSQDLQNLGSHNSGSIKDRSWRLFSISDFEL